MLAYRVAADVAAASETAWLRRSLWPELIPGHGAPVSGEQGGPTPSRVAETAGGSLQIIASIAAKPTDTVFESIDPMMRRDDSREPLKLLT